MCPPTLADVSASLEHINLAGNPRLDMIPKKIRGDTELILWVLRLHRDNEVESQYVLSCIDTLEGISRGATERHRELRLELKKVDEDRLELLRNLPTGIDKVLVIYEYLLKKAKTVVRNILQRWPTVRFILARVADDGPCRFFGSERAPRGSRASAGVSPLSVFVGAAVAGAAGGWARRRPSQREGLAFQRRPSVPQPLQ